jgi:formamidopyrimidine-DNA glycosylase
LQAANLLAVRETKRLHRAIRVVLRQGISNAGTTLGKGKTNFYSIQGGKGTNANHLKVFRRVGKPCPRCQSPIRRTIVGQRSTHICETCQRLE